MCFSLKILISSSYVEKIWKFCINQNVRFSGFSHELNDVVYWFLCEVGVFWILHFSGCWVILGSTLPLGSGLSYQCTELNLGSHALIYQCLWMCTKYYASVHWKWTLFDFQPLGLIFAKLLSHALSSLFIDVISMIIHHLVLVCMTEDAVNWINIILSSPT